MKKFIFIIGIICVLVSCSAKVPTAQEQNSAKAEANAQAAIVSIPIPSVSYFQEKRTIAKWAERWDTPALPTYVYLVSFGKILGYYVADGKPASTRSYLTPEYRNDHLYEGGNAEEPMPDIDGTYGDNNPGIRFFTAEGVAVEWAGEGASYLYSDAPINFGYDVPKLN